MPSGKQSKRRRAVVPPPPVGGTRRASPRVLLAAGGVVALIAVGVVLAVVLSGGKSSPKTAVPTRGSLVNALPGAVEANTLLAGIPQHGNVLGAASAPVTMVEYVDLQCPYCRDFETQAMTTLIPRYVRTGKVKVELRILAFIGPDSVRGRSAALAAAEQDRLFNFAELLYLNQGTENTGWLSEETVQAAAASVPGLDVPKLLADRGSGAIAKRGQAFDDQATADGVNSTPTILVGKSGSAPTPVRLSSPSDPKPVAAAIDAALR